MRATLSRLLVLVAALGSAPASAIGPFEAEIIPGAERRPTVILAPRSAPTAVLEITFDAGSFDDGPVHGLTRLTQHTLFEANRSKRFGDMVARLTAANASFEMATEVRECSFVLEANAADFPALAHDVANMLLAPQFRESEFPNALRRTLADESDPSHGAGLYSLVAAHIFNDGRYQNDPYGERSTLEVVTVGQVKEYVGRLLAPANATVVLTGAFDAAEWKTFLSRFSGGHARDKVRPALTLPQELNIESGREMHLVTYPVRLTGAREVASLRILDAVLGERAQRQFRADGVGYSVFVDQVRREWLDFLILFSPFRSRAALLDPKQNTEPLQAVAARCRDKELEADELERNRSFVRHQLERIDSEPNALAAQLNEGRGLPDWYSAAMVAQVDHLTAADLRAIWQPWLRPDNSIFIHFTPPIVLTSPSPPRRR